MVKFATQARIDFSQSARTVDSNGFMHVEGVPMFRSGIIEIPGIELQAWVPEKLNYKKKYRLRIKQEVIENYSKSFAHKPITWGHKWIGPNSKNDFIGFTGDNPFVEDDLVKDNMTIADADAVYRIGVKEREELSAGFVGEIIASTEPYADYDLISFECNHVAVVKRGKAGHRVRILNEMIENGEIEGSSAMEETKEIEKKEENVEKETEKKEEIEKSEENLVNKEEEIKENTEEDKKEEAPSVENNGSEEKQSGEEEKKDENVEKTDLDAEKKGEEEKKEEEKPEKNETEGETKEVNTEEKPSNEEKDIEPKAWSYKIDGVERMKEDEGPDIGGKSVEISFSEDGLYEVKEGKVLKVELEDLISEEVEKKAADMVEAFSICNKIDSGISLKKDTKQMYRSAARLVFGKSCDDMSEDGLKCMLQGYLLGKGAKLPDRCGVKEDFRTIEVNL